MKTYLEYKDEKSQKFWEITLDGSSHTVRYGKIGTTGQSKTLNFASAEETQKAIDKLIQSKLKKGYKNVEVDTNQLTESKQDNPVEKKATENTLKEKDIEDAKYLVRIIDDYDNDVSVLKKVAESTYNIEWEFELEEYKSSCDTFLEMFNKDCFVVVNEEAWVRIYSISKRELIFEKKYNADEDSKALISNDKTKLYIAYKPEADPSLSFIKIISLTDFSTLKTIQLPENFDISHFTLGSNNRLLFYYVKENPNSHGYNIINEITEKKEHFSMKHPQWAKFTINPPVINSKFNLGIMPYWNEIEVKKEENNNPLFVFKVMLFNLTDFNVEKIISIRGFTTQQLDKVRNFDTHQFDDKKTKAVCKKRAKIFQNKNTEDKNYKNAVTEFMSHLNSIVFNETSDSFWVCFRGGIVRNITLDGKLSPLFVTTSIPGYTDEGAFNFLHVETHIDTIEKNTIVLKSWNCKYHIMPLNKEELLSDKAIIEKELTKENIRDQALNIDYLLPEISDKDAQKDKIIEDTNYFIAIGRNEGGFNQIKVLKKISKGTYHLEWAFVLIGDDDTLRLSEMYNEDHLVIVNGNAWVRIYSISKKELIFEKKYGGNGLSEALISKDKSKLYIAYGRLIEDTQKRTATLEILSLTDFSSIKTIALPKRFKYYDDFIQGKDNSLLFCSAEEEDPWADDIIWKQGINVLNEDTEEIDFILIRDNLEKKPKTLDEFIKYGSKRTLYLQHGGIEIITSSEDEEDSTFEEAKKVVIEVADLNQEKSYLEALDKMIKLTQDIDAITLGNTLAFRVKDKNKKYEEDKVFFEKAIKINGATEKMEQIIANFIKHQTPITETVSLYINSETTALAYTVYHLVTSDPKYIDIAIQYLQVIYFGNDFFNKQNLIPLLKDKYHKKYGKQIIKKLKQLDKIAENWLLAYENHN